MVGAALWRAVRSPVAHARCCVVCGPADASSAVKELLALNEPFCGSDGEDERKTPGPRGAYHRLAWPVGADAGTHSSASTLCCAVARATATGRTFNFERLSIDERHVVKAVPHRVYSTAMHPTTTKPIAFVGSKWGHVGMWSPHDMHTDEDTGTTVFQPHARPVSGLVVHPTRAACVFSCSYDGSVRALDVTKQVRCSPPRSPLQRTTECAHRWPRVGVPRCHPGVRRSAHRRR